MLCYVLLLFRQKEAKEKEKFERRVLEVSPTELLANWKEHAGILTSSLANIVSFFQMSHNISTKV